MSSCACGRPGTHQTPTGRPKCDEHWSEFVTLSSAGAALASGDSPDQAVGAGIAAAGWANESDHERANAERRRARLAAATGFWSRLKIRLLG